MTKQSQFPWLRTFISPVAKSLLTTSWDSHLRVAGRFVRLAQALQSNVKVHCKDIIADGGSTLSLLSLAAECDTMLAVEAQGCDAEDALAALADLISAQFHESEDQNGEAGCLSTK